jgi:hypothetical protein
MEKIMNKLWLPLVFVAACAQVQRPYTISTPLPNTAVIDRVVRVLAEGGQQTAQVDAQAGVIYTRWQDTGFMYGQVQGATANIVRRYIVTVRPDNAGSSVSVRQDSQRCAQGQFSIGDAGVQGSCEMLEGLVEKHQHQLDELGARIDAGLKGGG